MTFNPKQEYVVVETKIQIKAFFSYKEDYITRPPYQRKSVWTIKKQQSLFDSIFRRYYIPRLVIREVRLSDQKSVKEIIDGQQRITVIQNFFDNKFKLPKSLKNISSELGNKFFHELSTEMRRFIDTELFINADIVKNIENSKEPEHQKVAAEIFWRLQQGEQLNFMEIAHAELSSLSRNFIVKYSDDETFDFDTYSPVDSNKNKHKFFAIIGRKNNRMQHLTLLARFILIEEADGYVDLNDEAVTEVIDKYIDNEGIGNDSFENQAAAKNCLSVLNLFYEIFKSDLLVEAKTKIKELSREYVIISFYMLVRHLKKNYVIKEDEKTLINNFFFEFYLRWNKNGKNDLDINIFSNNRQQSINNLQERDIILRQLFFEFAGKGKISLKSLDTKRAFDEAERISIYRRDRGLCQICLKEGKSELEAAVPWNQYQADHIMAYTLGGETTVDNGQVLCRYHNSKKGVKAM